MRKNLCLATIFSAFLCPGIFARQTPAAADGQVSPSTGESEPVMWKSIESSTDPTDYLAYLKQYPDGVHYAEAATRVESYALGLNFGSILMKQPVDMDTPSVLQGLQDEMDGGKTRMNDQEVNAALAELQSQEDANQGQKRTQAGDRGSYALGVNFGRKLLHQSLDVDTASLSRGLKDMLSGNKLLLTGEVAQAALDELQIQVSAKQDEQRTKVADANSKAGAEFLAKNKTKEGVVVLPSGVQYKILQKGTGLRPKDTDAVICNYRGTLVNGQEFESSEKDDGGPAIFIVRDAIPGWAEALQLMPVGSKWQLFIPGELAYGIEGKGPNVGPNATIILEVELISIHHEN